MGIITSQITISGSASSSISISNLSLASSLTNILVYNSASGLISYTSSAAVGGGAKSQTETNTKYLESSSDNYYFSNIYANERIILFDLPGTYTIAFLNFPIQDEALEGSKLTVKFVQAYGGTLALLAPLTATYAIETPTFTYAAGERVTWVYNTQEDKWFLY